MPGMKFSIPHEASDKEIINKAGHKSQYYLWKSSTDVHSNSRCFMWTNLLYHWHTENIPREYTEYLLHGSNVAPRRPWVRGWRRALPGNTFLWSNVSAYKIIIHPINLPSSHRTQQWTLTEICSDQILGVSSSIKVIGYTPVSHNGLECGYKLLTYNPFRCYQHGL